MTDQLERELRQLFAEDAEQAPTAALAEEAHRWVRRRRRTRLTWGAGVLAAGSVAAVAAFGSGLLSGTAPTGPVAVPPAITVATPRPTGPLAERGAASCARAYTPREVARLAFAFDGSVSSIGPGHSDRPGVDLGLVGVTFAVHEWFAGGSGATVTVDLPPPGGHAALSEGPPAYGLGSRLLVSGQHRWGGPTMADAIAWGCGFTRFYDETTADSWRTATR